MKIRYGFVSNSSSSSFTCDICKETVEVYDDGDGDFLTCEAGHCVCASHIKDKPSLKSLRESAIKLARESYGSEELEQELEEIESMDKDYLEGYIREMCDCELPSASCPLCQFTTITDDDLMDYLLMLVHSTKKAMIASVLKNHPNHSAFIGAIKNHKKEMKEQGKK